MSKFIDKLQHIYQGSTPSIGFRKSTADEGSAPLAFIIDLTKLSDKKIETVAGDVDAAIVSNAGLDASGFERLAAALGDVPLGLLMDGNEKQNVEIFADKGCDFIIFDLEMPLTLVSNEKVGKILRIGPSLDHGLVKTISELQLTIDGVLVDGEESSITIGRLLIYRRLADLLDKPLLITSGSLLSGDELSNLCQAGVNGLVFPELPAKTIAEMKKTIINLPKSTKRGTRGVVLLPRLGSDSGIEMGDEEEEED